MELRFGSFITPSASDPASVVALAVASETAGLDLVTFQDHPYQPAFLDTWTLMSFVAARTRRIHISANVHNLPFRPAPVLARAAASLDLLSGGRVALALGSGAFGDATVAMGVRRLTPGEGVSALIEAIPLIRDLWDTETRGGVFRDGEFYHVAGAKRGPAPAHPIPIWLGAYKPRMLRLVDAAADAGRRPDEIRRLLNIPPQAANAEALAQLALEYRVDTFILASDDEGQLRRFGEETAPEATRLVGAARG